MHNISQSCKLIKFAPVVTLDERCAEFLESIFEVVAIDYTDDGLEQYVGYAPLSFDETQLAAQAKQADLSLPPFQLEILESKNWLKENVIKFPPFEVGDFLVYGIHETACPATPKLPLQIYAATAFGSDHQTTRMCLTAITELYHQHFIPQKILDMGTGSGILSLAAAKIWQQKPQIIAADIDQESVDVTANNAITNNLEQNIHAILSDGYHNPLITQTAPFDLILANILANPLKAMSKSAYQALASQGCYLISGFIDNQQQDIIQHHQKVGFKIIKTYQIDNWCAALLQKE
ncbi:MAG: 50S ribosomal protein L11 methyltransferase [Alphaproteobacteria bacterium]|nr:50S ribosomal protein L11 methyltransferase [Alphaproteobacteria bacterium]